MKEKNIIHLQGSVQSGVNQAVFFTQLEWVKEQCAEFTGFTPVPGTLNVQIADSSVNEWLSLVNSCQVLLKPPAPDFCPALLLPCQISGSEGSHEAAAVVPLVDGYPQTLAEILAPVKLRGHLKLKDGDAVKLSFLVP